MLDKGFQSRRRIPKQDHAGGKAGFGHGGVLGWLFCHGMGAPLAAVNPVC
ncbi:hypothetical protein Pure02_31320 [Paenarthrobacter ureafaciens]|nr:hypothetical protein Pure02_31320 [Paenarthrobacter ureafaciens]GLU69285.1 hypothetical protein Pure03_32610 [Paenarthrobacter ureafaciens]